MSARAVASSTTEKRTGAEGQRGFVARCRTESNLDRDTPLGYPACQTWKQVELGVPTQVWFAQKVSRGEHGRFDPLYVTRGWANGRDGE